MNDTGKRVVFITASGEDEARRIASALVEERLAACVNIAPHIRSIYRWEGKVCDDPESLLIVKTGEDKLGALIERAAQLHSYDTPEVIAVPVTEGFKGYLDWIGDCLD